MWSNIFKQNIKKFIFKFDAFFRIMFLLFNSGHLKNSINKALYQTSDLKITLQNFWYTITQNLSHYSVITSIQKRVSG